MISKDIKLLYFGDRLLQYWKFMYKVNKPNNKWKRGVKRG